MPRNNVLHTEDYDLIDRLSIALSGKGQKFAMDKYSLSRPGALRGKWEGYHLLDYVDYLIDSNDSLAFEDNLEKTLQRSHVGDLEQFRGRPSGRGTPAKYISDLFDNLAQLLGLEHKMLLVREFLIYCYEQSNWSFTIFSDHDELLSVIRGIEDRYSGLINPDQESSEENSGVQIVWQENGYQITQSVGEQRLLIPEHRENLNADNISSLLDWSHELTPFIGRDGELALLREWLIQDVPIDVKLIYGNAGMGKTRLAYHFAKQARDLGWEAGDATPNFEGNWLCGENGILIIVDDSEEKVKVVASLLRSLYSMPKLIDTKIRLLMICRNREYLEFASSQAPGLVSAPLSINFQKENERWEFFQSTCSQMLELCGNDSSSIKRGMPISSSTFDNWSVSREIDASPLLITALAINFVEKIENDLGLELDIDIPELFQVLSNREIARLRAELSINAHKHSVNFDIESVILLKALSAITGHMDSLSISSITAYLKDNNSDAEIPRSLSLTSTSIWSNGGISPLKPDLLSSFFLAYILDKWVPSEKDTWLGAALHVTSSKLNGDHEEKLQNSLVRLGRIILDVEYGFNFKTELSGSIENLLSTSKKLSTLLANLYLNHKTLNFPLDLIAQAIRTVLEGHLSLECRAKYLLSLSNVLETSDIIECIEANQDSIVIYRKLVQKDFAKYGERLMLALFKCSTRYARIKRLDRTIGLRDEGYNYYKKIEQYSSEEIRIEIAIASIHNDSVVGPFSPTDSYDRLNLIEYIVNQGYIAYEPDLADALCDMSKEHANFWRKDEAFVNIERAVEIKKKLYIENPSRFWHGYALSLDTLSDTYHQYEDFESALFENRKALDLFDKHCSHDIVIYISDYLASLRGMSSILVNMHKPAEASKANFKALDLCEQYRDDLGWMFYLELKGECIIDYCIGIDPDIVLLKDLMKIYDDIQDVSERSWVIAYGLNLDFIRKRADFLKDKQAIAQIEIMEGKIDYKRRARVNIERARKRLSEMD